MNTPILVIQLFQNACEIIDFYLLKKIRVKNTIEVVKYLFPAKTKFLDAKHSETSVDLASR